jgi:hypothetical protein
MQPEKYLCKSFMMQFQTQLENTCKYIETWQNMRLALWLRLVYTYFVHARRAFQDAYYFYAESAEDTHP